MTPCTPSGSTQPKWGTRRGAKGDEPVHIPIGGARGFLLVPRGNGVLAPGRERAPGRDGRLALEPEVAHAGARRRCRDRRDLSDEPADRVVGRVLVAGGAEGDVRVQPASEPAHRVGLRNPGGAWCSAGTVAS